MGNILRSHLVFSSFVKFDELGLVVKGRFKIRDESRMGRSKKRRDDGTRPSRYATGHCPVVVYVRRTHYGTLAWPVALFKRRDRR